MSHYTDIMVAVSAVGSGGIIAIGVGARKILAKLDRVGDAYEQVAGKPAVLDRSGAIVEHARPGLPAQLAVVRQLAEDANAGNVEILRRQDKASQDHQKLVERVGRIETKVGQTLNAVTTA